MPKKPRTHRPIQKITKRVNTAPARPQNDRIYNYAWRVASKRYLRSNPLCVECLKKDTYTPAREVDHITPHKGEYAAFWDATNWQALCKSCHSRKTREDQRHGAKVPSTQAFKAPYLDSLT